MTKLLIGFFVAAAVATSLPSAQAYADTDSDFLEMVSKLGLDTGKTPEDVELTLAGAFELCQLFTSGYSPAEVLRQVKYIYPNASPAQQQGYLDAAEAKMCPLVLEPLTPLGS